MFVTRTGLGIALLIGYTSGHFFGRTFAFVVFWCVLAGLAPVLLPNLVYRWTDGWPVGVRFLLSLVTLGVILAYMYFLYSHTGIGAH